MSKSKNNKKDSASLAPVLAGISAIYVVLVFTLMTFYMHNAYYDTLEAKSAVVFKTTIVYICTMAIFMIVDAVSTDWHKLIFVRYMKPTDWALTAFAATALISVFMADDRSAAWLGTDSLRMGADLLIVLAIAAIFLTHTVRIDYWMITLITAVGIVVFIWYIADCLDADPFHWYEGMISSHYDFVVTMGNRDWYVGWLALVLPFVAGFYLYDDSHIMDYAYHIIFFTGFITLLWGKSDGVLLILGCVMLLVYLALKDQRALRKLIILFGIFTCSCLLTDIVTSIRGTDQFTGHTIISRLLLHHGEIIFIVAFIILKLWGENLMKIRHRIGIWIGICAAAVASFAVILFANADGTTGSNRGYVWQYTFDAFGKSETIKKIFGWGADCYKSTVYALSGDLINSTWPEDNYVANAHSEPWQYLITTGILGMLAWFAVYITVFIALKRKKDAVHAAAAVALLSYFCTALGFNPNALNYALLIVVYGVAAGSGDHCDPGAIRGFTSSGRHSSGGGKAARKKRRK